MKQITNEELTAIRERAEKATAKPWSVVTDELGGQAMTVIDGDNWDVIRRPYVGKDNAIFIANARQDIPKLLAEIERLKSELSSLCPIGDLDVVTTLQVEKRYLTEVIAEKDAEIERLREKIEEAESLLSDAQSLMGNVHCYDTDEYRAISGYFYGGEDE